jgi:hypothetical protein
MAPSVKNIPRRLLRSQRIAGRSGPECSNGIMTAPCWNVPLERRAHFLSPRPAVPLDREVIEAAPAVEQAALLPASRAAAVHPHWAAAAEVVAAADSGRVQAAADLERGWQTVGRTSQVPDEAPVHQVSAEAVLRAASSVPAEVAAAQAWAAAWGTVR